MQQVNDEVRRQELRVRALTRLSEEVAGAPPLEQLLVPARELVSEVRRAPPPRAPARAPAARAIASAPAPAPARSVGTARPSGAKFPVGHADAVDEEKSMH